MIPSTPPAHSKRAVISDTLPHDFRFARSITRVNFTDGSNDANDAAARVQLLLQAYGYGIAAPRSRHLNQRGNGPEDEPLPTVRADKVQPTRGTALLSQRHRQRVPQSLHQLPPYVSNRIWECRAQLDWDLGPPH